MKIETFLKEIQNKILYQPNIDIHTFKIFLEAFEKNLSEKEENRVKDLIFMLKEFIDSQTTITQFAHKLNTKELENELKVLKNGKTK
jgi:hypothetical protein